MALKLNATHTLQIYADNVNMLGGSVHTIKENGDGLVVASKEIGLEVNVDKTKYMVMSCNQNAGRSHNIKIDNNSFERVEEFKYLGTKFYSEINKEQSEVRECLLLFSAESFVFQFAVQKFKDSDIQNYNFACCFVWV